MIIKRYLLKEVFFSFSAVLALLILIFIGNRFALFLGQIIEGQLSGDVLLDMLVAVVMTALDILLPLSLYIAILIALGRLYKDNEMTALSASGVGYARIFQALALPTIICVVTVAVVAFYAKPWSMEMRYQLKEVALSQSELIGIKAGGFTQSTDGDWVFYVEELSSDRKIMRNVFVQGLKGEAANLYTAPIGRHHIDEDTGDQFLLLENGYRYEGEAGVEDYKIYEYELAAVRIKQREIDPLSRKRKAYPTSRLWNSTLNEDIAELQWRISMPISTLLLAILAIPLSFTTPREGRFAKLFGAIVIYILYTNLMGVAQAWLVRGEVSPSLGMWWVHGLMIMFIILLILKRYGFDWCLAVISGRARAV